MKTNSKPWHYFFSIHNTLSLVSSLRVSLIYPQERCPTRIRKKVSRFRAPFGHTTQWESQKCHPEMPQSNNIFLAGSIVSTGIHRTKCLCFFILKCPQALSLHSSESRKLILCPQLFIFMGLNFLPSGRVAQSGRRIDSYNKFGSHTMMELKMGKVVNFQVIQVNTICVYQIRLILHLECSILFYFLLLTIVTYINIIKKNMVINE